MSLEHLAFVYNLSEERVQEILAERARELEQIRSRAIPTLGQILGILE